MFWGVEGEGSGVARTRVEDDYGGSLVQFGAVRLCVGSRTYHALLFSGEKNETNAALWFQARGFNRAQGVHHERRITPVIERSRTQFPRIQVGAENDKFVRLLAAFEFCDNVGRFDWSADFIWNTQIRPDRM